MSNPREDRFQAIYSMERQRILAYALRRTSNVEDAADVVAETFEIAWRKLDDLPQGSGAVLWLYATARRVLANATRRSQSRSGLVARVAQVLAEQGVARPVDETVLTAHAALQALDLEDREILMLSGWEGLNDVALGRVLGCSPGAARIRLHRARRRLEDSMATVSDEQQFQKQPALARHTRDEDRLVADAQETA